MVEYLCKICEECGAPNDWTVRPYRWCSESCRKAWVKKHPIGPRPFRADSGSPGAFDWKTPWGNPPVGARGRTGADSSSGPGFGHS